MLTPIVQFLTYGMVQVIRFEFVERIAWTTQVLGERIGQTLIESGVLHVDHNRTDSGLLDLVGYSVSFFLGWKVPH